MRLSDRGRFIHASSSLDERGELVLDGNVSLLGFWVVDTTRTYYEAEWWNGSSWVSTETWITSTSESVTFPEGSWTSGLDYEWGVSTRDNFAVRGPYSPSWTVSIVQTVATEVQLAWNVVQSVQTSVDLPWNVEASLQEPVSSELSAFWDTLQTTASTTSPAWRVSMYVSRDSILPWSTLSHVSTSLEAPWDVLTSALNFRSFEWNILAVLTAGRSFHPSWNVVQDGFFEFEGGVAKSASRRPKNEKKQERVKTHRALRY